MDNKFQQLYDMVLTSSDFRRHLVSDPNGALESIGIEPTPQILEALQAIEGSVQNLEEIFGSGHDNLTV